MRSRCRYLSRDVDICHIFIILPDFHEKRHFWHTPVPPVQTLPAVGLDEVHYRTYRTFSTSVYPPNVSKRPHLSSARVGTGCTPTSHKCHLSIFVTFVDICPKSDQNGDAKCAQIPPRCRAASCSCDIAPHLLSAVLEGVGARGRDISKAGPTSDGLLIAQVACLRWECLRRVSRALCALPLVA